MQTAVAIPVRNGRAWLGATLASVLAQTQRPAEIVVVDDGSTDDSAALARSFAGVSVVANPGRGVQDARRRGYERTQSPLVAFLDADDLWHPQHLADLTDLLARTGAPAAMARWQPFADERTLALHAGTGALRNIDPWAEFPACPVPTPSCVLIRRSALAAVGGWPTDFRLGCDWHTWLRLGERAPLVGGDGLTVGYRRLPQSMSSRLRTTAPQEYFAHVSTALAAAVEAFRATGRDATAVDRRWLAFRAVGTLLDAAFASDLARVRAATAECDRLLAAEPPAVAAACLDTLAFYLVARESPGPIAGERERLLAVAGAWPRAHPAMRRQMFGRVNVHAWRRGVREQLRRAPWRLDHWLVWAGIASCALAKNKPTPGSLLRRIFR